jgi:hypothetical protein
MRNPPAFDRFLFKYQEQLVKVVPPEWLPEPVFIASAAAKEIEHQKRRLELLPDFDMLGTPDRKAVVLKEATEIIARLIKKPQSRKGFKEYGAGHYGVVYPTQKPGIVCKITTDASEAQTVANMMTWNNKPDGIVKYYAVFQFAGSSIKRRPVYILWRDEVQPITLASVDRNRHSFAGPGRGTHDQNMLDLLHYTKWLAHTARMWVKAAMAREWKKSASYKQVWTDIAWARDNDDDFYYDNLTHQMEHGEPYYFTKRIARLPFRVRMAHVLYALRYGWRDLMAWSYAFYPGQALFTCLENDMLLADVHANNVMKAQDGSWEISDPGHMIELSDRYAHVKIPTL